MANSISVGFDFNSNDLNLTKIDWRKYLGNNNTKRTWYTNCYPYVCMFWRNVNQTLTIVRDMNSYRIAESYLGITNITWLDNGFTLETINDSGITNPNPGELFNNNNIIYYLVVFGV